MSLLDLMFLMQNEKTVKSFHDIYIYMQIITLAEILFDGKGREACSD